MTIKIAVTGTIVFLAIFSGCCLCHMRGPHHPKNSPKLSTPPEHHQHYRPRGGGPGEATPILTHDKNVLHDKEHIREDLGDWVNAGGKEMTPEEMEFHYFKMHDFDNNSMLDGLEILQAISHIMPEEGQEDIDLTKDPDRKEANFNYYIELIDRVLEEDDTNRDGYLSYFEYVVGRRKEENEQGLQLGNRTHKK